MLTKRESFGAVLRGAGLFIWFFVIIYPLSLLLPAENRTVIGNAPLWMVITFSIIALICYVASRLIIKKESKRNHFC